MACLILRVVGGDTYVCRVRVVVHCRLLGRCLLLLWNHFVRRELRFLGLYGALLVSLCGKGLI